MTEEAAAKQKAKYALIDPQNILKLYEARFSARYCSGCKTMVSLERFPRPEKYAPRHFICRLHRAIPGRPVKYKDLDSQLRRKAAISIRTRARDDRAVFGQALMDLSLEEMQDMLTQDHVDKYTDFAIVPARPTEMLSKQNVVIVSFSQRRYLTAMWKALKDPEAYERDMATLLNIGNKGSQQTDTPI